MRNTPRRVSAAFTRRPNAVETSSTAPLSWGGVPNESDTAMPTASSTLPAKKGGVTLPQLGSGPLPPPPPPPPPPPVNDGGGDYSARFSKRGSHVGLPGAAEENPLDTSRGLARAQRAASMFARRASKSPRSGLAAGGAQLATPEEAEFARFLNDAVHCMPVTPAAAAAAAAAVGSIEVGERFVSQSAAIDETSRGGSGGGEGGWSTYELPAGQRNQLDAMLEERTKLLNKLFEEQLKKQYDTMKKEAAKLAKRHQRDVAQLDDRLKQKMAGLATRFKQLEAEEAQMELVRQENRDLQTTVARLEGVIEEQERCHAQVSEANEQREKELGEARGKIADQETRDAETRAELASREEAMAKAQAQMDATVGVLQTSLDERTGELKEMQKRLLAAKQSYQGEVDRKHVQVVKLEESLSALDRRTQSMQGFVGQVQAQISQREADMRTQLGLMKNTIAFALYVDETLLVDLSDPTTTELMSSPVVVQPSGISYSKSTVDALVEAARATGGKPLCPQTGRPIESFAANAAVESILARYLFKQQVTHDVITALREFNEKGAVSEDDQPLEVYVQRMKANMVERMNALHQEQVGKVALEYEEQLVWRKGEMDKHADELEKLQRQLDDANDGAMKFKQHALNEAAVLEQQLAEARARLDERTAERDELAAGRDGLMETNRSLEDQLRLEEEELADDAAALDDDAASERMARVRKADVLSLRAQLEAAAAQQAAADALLLEAKEEARRVAGELEGVRAEHAAASQLNDELTDEREQLSAKVRALTKDNAAMTERVRSLDSAAALAQELEGKQGGDLRSARDRLREAELTVKQLELDTDKLRERLKAKEGSVRQFSSELATARLKLEEATSEGSRRERLLGGVREELVAANQQASVAAERCNFAMGEAERLKEEARLAREEALALAQAKAKAEAVAQQLQERLDELGAGDAGKSLELKSMDEVREYSGANAPIAVLPRVPVLDRLTESIEAASKSIHLLSEKDLKDLAKTEPLNVSHLIGQEERAATEAAAAAAAAAAPAPAPAPPPAPAPAATADDQPGVAGGGEATAPAGDAAGAEAVAEAPAAHVGAGGEAGDAVAAAVPEGAAAAAEDGAAPADEAAAATAAEGAEAGGDGADAGGGTTEPPLA